MAVAGKPLGRPIKYKDREVLVTFYGPDLLVYVDEQQVGDFWIDVASADAGARRHIDLQEREAANVRR